MIWQIIGTVVCIGAGVLTALVLSAIFKAFGGMRIDDDMQAEGLDVAIWGIEPDVQPIGEYESKSGVAAGD